MLYSITLQMALVTMVMIAVSSLFNVKSRIFQAFVGLSVLISLALVFVSLSVLIWSVL